MNLKELQSLTKKWIDEKGSKWSNYAQYCHLVEEVGELGEALVVKQGERKAGLGTKGYADHTDLNEEIGDILFNLTAIANQHKIDLEKSFNDAVVRYNKKLKK